MQHPKFTDSTQLLAAELINKSYLPGLKSLLLVLLAGAPLVIILSLIGHGHLSHVLIAAIATALAGLAYWLLQRGHYRWASHLLVFNLIGSATAGLIVFGSVRSSVLLGFACAIMAAGMTLGRKALVAALVLCAASLAALTWAEATGLLVPPDLRVDLRFWLVAVLLLTAIAASVYTSRQMVMKAMSEQQNELLRRETAERELEISENRFSRIFRSSPAAIVVQAIDSMTVMDVNPAFERLYGYTRAEFIGRSDAVLWEDPKAHQAFLAQMQDTGRVVNLSMDARRKDGSRINILLSTEVEGEGRRRIVVTTITDITAQNQARLAARQSAELFSAAFNFSPLRMSINRFSDGTYLAVNATDDQVQGLSPAELIGKTSVEVGIWRDEKERKLFNEKLLKQGKKLSREAQVRHKDGHMVDVRIWSALVDISGERCVLSSRINITDQKKREAMLIDVAKGLSTETGEAFFRAVAVHLGQAIEADLLLVGEISDALNVDTLAMVEDGQLQPNIRYSLAGTPCDVALRTADMCIHGDGIQQRYPEDHFLVDGNYHAYAGVALRDADGTTVGVISAMWHKPQTASPDRDALLQIFASRIASEVVRLRRDREISRLNETLEQRVTERTEQLQAANAELESFSYSVSHDLQSPLRSIQGFSVLLERRLQGRMSDEEQRLMDRVRSNVLRMHELINDLLALARVSKGKLLLEPVNLSAMAEKIITEQQQREPQRQVEVSITPGISALCDSKFARITLENLLGNAWKYSRKQSGAKIEFGALPKREGGRRLLFVRDNGAGFDMAYADKLFQPFQRLHHDSEFEGSGIGLATVHRILERHGGMIRGESAVDKGACFTFSFDPRFGVRPP